MHVRLARPPGNGNVAHSVPAGQQSPSHNCSFGLQIGTQIEPLKQYSFARQHLP